MKDLYEMKNFEECNCAMKSIKEKLRKGGVMQDQLKLYARVFCRDFSLLLKFDRNLLNNLRYLNTGFQIMMRQKRTGSALK